MRKPILILICSVFGIVVLIRASTAPKVLSKNERVWLFIQRTCRLAPLPEGAILVAAEHCYRLSGSLTVLLISSDRRGIDWFVEQSDSLRNRPADWSYSEDCMLKSVFPRDITTRKWNLSEKSASDDYFFVNRECQWFAPSIRDGIKFSLRENEGGRAEHYYVGSTMIDFEKGLIYIYVNQE